MGDLTQKTFFRRRKYEFYLYKTMKKISIFIASSTDFISLNISLVHQNIIHIASLPSLSPLSPL